MIDETTVELLTEMVEWHSDPDSPAYNDCDLDLCDWCGRAKVIIKQFNEETNK